MLDPEYEARRARELERYLSDKRKAEADRERREAQRPDPSTPIRRWLEQTKNRKGLDRMLRRAKR